MQIVRIFLKEKSENELSSSLLHIMSLEHTQKYFGYHQIMINEFKASQHKCKKLSLEYRLFYLPDVANVPLGKVKTTLFSQEPNVGQQPLKCDQKTQKKPCCLLKKRCQFINTDLSPFPNKGNSRKKLTKVTLKAVSANSQAGRILYSVNETEKIYVIWQQNDVMNSY